MTLAYTTYYNNPDNTSEKPITKLIYMSKSDDYMYDQAQILVDSSTGKLMGYDGQELVKSSDQQETQTITGDPYEKELGALGSNGFFDLEDFHPDQLLTHRELFKALVGLKGGRYNIPQQLPELKFTDVDKKDADYITLQKAVSFGILKNEAVALNLDSTVTREEAVKALMDITPFGVLSSLKGIYKLDYSDASDISDQNVGDIAIAKGLNFFDENLTTLHPKDNIKLDEFYHYVYTISSYVKQY